MKILIVFGTRPEAIKMCPLVLKLQEYSEFDCVVCLTGQHKEMLKQVMDSFGIVEDYNLDIMKDKQTLTTITISILEKLEPILEIERPDLVLVHGDTTTSYAAAVASFYQKIPVGHIEAGLRSHDIYSPFPEEMNRILTDKLCSYYFAPTEENKSNLLAEGIGTNIFVTGNTVIDAFEYTVKNDYVFANNVLNSIDFDSKRIITITAHRRENIGDPLLNICRAIKRISKEYDDVVFIYPVHLNPLVKDTVLENLSDLDDVKLIEPIDVFDMHNLIARSYMIMTDSGGIQEEAPHFGKPVLVLRNETERPEAVKAGTVKVVGVNEDEIYINAKTLLDSLEEYQNMAKSINPYGDGHACERIAKALLKINSLRE